MPDARAPARLSLPLLLLALASSYAACVAPSPAAEIATGEVYGVVQLDFTGPAFGPADAPARDVEFSVRFRHEGGREVTIHGFWDGDGNGGARGDVFRVRFCPTSAGRWTLAEVKSGTRELDGQRQGDWVTAAEARGGKTGRKGFWLPDDASPGRRWCRRSDGSYAYVFGNTMYSFVSTTTDRGPRKGDPSALVRADVESNGRYFNKLRFGVHGDRYPHPSDKPFLDDAGKPTDRGDFSFRPNPGWFHERVDAAVSASFESDLIADLILNGPDVKDSRSILRPAGSGGDPSPWLRYVAARYGSYPNVWFCLSNEWDIKDPFTPEQVRRAGETLRRLLPYPTPVSVHPVNTWSPKLNGPADGPRWYDHAIIQDKLKKLPEAADAIGKAYRAAGGNCPVINDELAYQGEGDKFTEGDVIESHLGAFLGGGYASTGYKPGNKKGHYFWGAFDPDEHTAADNLKWLRDRIDAEVTFWKMRPVPTNKDIFENTSPASRVMEWNGRQYVLGTNGEQRRIRANLPEGKWRVERLDVMSMKQDRLSADASGAFTFDAPASRAVLFVFTRQTAGDAGE